MDSTGFPPEAFQGGQQAIWYLLPLLMGLVLPIVLSGIKKLSALGKVDEGMITAVLAIGMTFGLSRLFAPAMTWGEIISLASMGGFLSIVLPYGARLTQKHDKGRNWRNKP